MNPSIELHKILSSYEDPEWENFVLFREKIAKGWTLFLNNSKATTLAEALKWGEGRIRGDRESRRPFKEDESNFFFALDNVVGNIRPYLHKGVVYNYRNDYCVVINGQEFIKPKSMDWVAWTCTIEIPAKCKITIKEKPDQEWWEKIIEKSFLRSPEDYYQKLQERITGEYHFVYLYPLNNYLSNLKVNIKVTKKTKQHFLDTFQVNQISRNLSFLGLLSQDRSHLLWTGRGRGKLARFKELHHYRENQLLKFNLLINQE